MTTIDTDQPIHDQIDALRDEADAAVPADVRDYYDGEHAPVATPDQMAALGDRAVRTYIENQLKRCTDVIASRLLFRSFICDNDAVKDALAGFAVKNQLSKQMVTNTVRVLVDGNNALSLSWNIEQARPVIHQERWWDGREGIYVEVSDTGVSEWAVKEWVDRDKRKRRTLYLPNEIRRYIQLDAGWSLYPDDAEGVVPWTRNGQLDGEPLGVPVVHFGNTVTTDSFHGTSTLYGLMGLQDALNGAIFDISAAGATNAFGIYTATGVDQNDTGLSVGPGRLWKAQNENANFGLLNGSSMTPILDGYKAIRAAIANQFPVAEHLVAGGNFPSGLALIKAENPMVGHVKLLGETFAPSWVLLAHRAVEMMNTFGKAGLDEDALIQVEYAPPEQLDESTVVEIDRARVDVYTGLANLPKELMVKTGLVTETQANEIIAERNAARSAFFADLDGGQFGQDYEDGNVA